MCTVTWLLESGRLHLLHNRDELHTRQSALAPRIHERNGVRFIAPVDADAGGTWIGVNECGLAACLLNRYDLLTRPTPQAGFISRGLLLTALLSASSVPEVAGQVMEMPLERYQPFQLVLAQLNTGVLVLDWTGAALRIDTQPAGRLPLVSSSVDGVGASAVRSRIYQALPNHITLADLRAFHASHAEGPSAYSVCMHRADAATVSFTEIELTPQRASLRYVPGAPCIDAARRGAQILNLSLVA